MSSTKNDLSINSGQKDMRIRNTSKKISLIRKSHNTKIAADTNANTILADRDDLTHVRVNSRLMNKSVHPTS